MDTLGNAKAKMSHSFLIIVLSISSQNIGSAFPMKNPCFSPWAKREKSPAISLGRANRRSFRANLVRGGPDEAGRPASC